MSGLWPAVFVSWAILLKQNVSASPNIGWKVRRHCVPLPKSSFIVFFNLHIARKNMIYIVHRFLIIEQGHEYRKNLLPRPKGVPQHVDSARKWQAHGRNRLPHPQCHGLQGLERSPLEFCQCWNKVKKYNVPNQHSAFSPIQYLVDK